MKIPQSLVPILEKHQREIPVKLGALAADLGLDVFKSTLKPGISGLIEPSNSSPSGYSIRLNRHEPVTRQRFTLAHEISHFILHRFEIGQGLVDDTMYRSKLSDRKEVEANKLASILIMPDNLVERERRSVQAYPKDEQVAVLADKFRVSKEAMRIKLGY